LLDFENGYPEKGLLMPNLKGTFATCDLILKQKLRHENRTVQCDLKAPLLGEMEETIRLIWSAKALLRDMMGHGK
jgi:hypothetical protein